LIKRFYPKNDKTLNFKFVQNEEDFIVEEQPIKFSGAGSFLVLKIEKNNCDTWELIDRCIMSKLAMVNYIPMMSFHIKEKKFPDKITGDEYTVYAPEIPASVYDKIFKDMNYVMMFEDNSFIKNGYRLSNVPVEPYKNNEKKIRVVIFLNEEPQSN
jgi:hypothetical protein